MVRHESEVNLPISATVLGDWLASGRVCARLLHAFFAPIDAGSYKHRADTVLHRNTAICQLLM